MVVPFMDGEVENDSSFFQKRNTKSKLITSSSMPNSTINRIPFCHWDRQSVIFGRIVSKKGG